MDKSNSNEISKLFYEKKISAMNGKKQVSIWADNESIAILETYNINGESKTQFIKRAIKELAMKENPNWFENKEE